MGIVALIFVGWLDYRKTNNTRKSEIYLHFRQQLDDRKRGLHGRRSGHRFSFFYGR